MSEQQQDRVTRRYYKGLGPFEVAGVFLAFIFGGLWGLPAFFTVLGLTVFATIMNHIGFQRI